jgi:hypothetical protein
LSSLYKLPGLAAHNPADLDWPRLPERCALQIHWLPTPSFLRQLEVEGFLTVVLSRHPLDVLLSILHFAPYEPETSRWLEGHSGNEQGIYGAMPCSAAFQAYATSPRAAALLSVSRDWWRRPECKTVGYENLVENPHRELQRLGAELGLEPTTPIMDALADNSMRNLRVQTQCAHHFWQGQPGLWRHLLTAGPARQIFRAHEQTVAILGYTFDPDESLTSLQADANWIQLAGKPMADILQAPRREERRVA